MKFLETFLRSNFEDQNLLCELYLHEMAYPLDRHSNLVPFSGDVQLRAFVSFVSNHVQWEMSFQTFSHNESHSNLWIRSEPQNPRLLLARHQSLLSCPIQTQHIMELQEGVIYTCTSQISIHQQTNLERSKHRWQVASPILRNRDPYCYRNFEQALSRIEGYVGCIRECRLNWLGLKFKFPLIWWPTKPYREDFSLNKVEKQKCWRYWVVHKGFIENEGAPEFPYNFSSLHEQSIVQDLDSN